MGAVASAVADVAFWATAASFVNAFTHARPEHAPGEADRRALEAEQQVLNSRREALEAQREACRQQLQAERERDEAARRRQMEQEMRQAREEHDAAFRQMEKQMRKENVNVGFFGASGAGKSSLINRMLGSAQAPVDVKECTQEPTPFTSKNITLWDLPGGNTARFPRESYIKQMGLRYFDGLVIVTSSRVTQIDGELFQQAQAWKIPTFLVRTKADIDLENNQEDKGMAPAKTLEVLQEDLRSHLASQSNGQVAREVGLFVLSARSRKFPEELGPEFDGLVRALHSSVQKSRGGTS